MTDDCSNIDRETKRAVLARDEYCCQLCGRAGNRSFPELAPSHQDEPVPLHVHHKVPQEKDGPTELSNLITLCKDCHLSHHHDPAPQSAGESGIGGTVVEHVAGFADPESTEAEIYAVVARHGPVRTGQVAEAVGKSSEHTRRLLYRLGARDLVAPTRDGGWDLDERVADPPTGECPDTAALAAIRTRDELLRRAAEWGLDDGELAEIADVSPRTARIAVDRAATYEVPLPDDDGVATVEGTGGVEENAGDDADKEEMRGSEGVDGDPQSGDLGTFGGEVSQSVAEE